MAPALTAGRRAARAACLAFLCLSAGCQACPDRAVVEWLSRDCFLGESGGQAPFLRQGGWVVERALIDALENGPPQVRLDAVSAAAARRYDEVLGALRSGRSYGLTVTEINRIEATGRDTFARRARERFDEHYRSAAAAALVILARPRGLRRLKNAAADPRSPLAELAAEALASVNTGSGSP